MSVTTSELRDHSRASRGTSPAEVRRYNKGDCMKAICALFALALAACATEPADDEDLPSAGATEDDAITTADTSFYAQADDAVVAEPGDEAPDTTISLTSTTRGERAIGWYKAHAGSTAYEGMCELAAELSFGTRGRYPSAIANWNAQVRAGRAHRGDRSAPRGALVFWNTSVFGHVAVADGSGGEWSTSVNHRIGHATSTRYFVNYLGWAWAPTSWPGR
jgi:hypothetical protein